MGNVPSGNPSGSELPYETPYTPPEQKPSGEPVDLPNIGIDGNPNAPTQEEVNNDNKPVKPVDQGNMEVDPPEEPREQTKHPRLNDMKTISQSKTNTTSSEIGTVPGTAGIQINEVEYHKPDSNFLTETRTVRHTWEGFLSVNNIQPTSGRTGEKYNAFDVVLNHPYEPITTANGFAVQSSTETITTGCSVVPAPHRVNTDNDAANTRRRNERGKFPRQMILNNEGVPLYNTPTWLNWYTKLYRYYTPLSAKYRATVGFNNFIINQSAGSTQSRAWSQKNSDILIGVFKESYVQSNKSDQRPYVVKTLAENEVNEKLAFLGKRQYDKFKGMKWYKLSAPREIGQNGPPTITIYGSWKPGDHIGSVRNLDDVKSWYATGAKPDPEWYENNSFVFITDDYNTCWDQTGIAPSDGNAAANPPVAPVVYTVNYESNMNGPCVNVHLEMEWIVQYKDLKDNVKYCIAPTHGNRAVHLRPGIDDVQFPYPIQNHRTSPYIPTVPVYPGTMVNT